jgi:hypothetical protein
MSVTVISVAEANRLYPPKQRKQKTAKKASRKPALPRTVQWVLTYHDFTRRCAAHRL